jgi:dienelactone hydrolase
MMAALTRRNMLLGATTMVGALSRQGFADSGPQFLIDHLDALTDLPVAIRLAGFTPQALVEVSAEMTGRDGQRWLSRAQFLGDDNGAIDLTTQTPVNGTYMSLSPMGLLWSMQLQSGGHAAETAHDVMSPLSVSLAAHDPNGRTATTTIRRRVAGAGVTRHEVRERGLVGSLFLPPGNGPFPAVISLSGSGGGVNEPRAALLASHGFATLALGYFNMPGLPSALKEIPLEYFAGAMTWMLERPEVRPVFVGVLGNSRGGELALLLGANFPVVSAVVAIVPQAYADGSSFPQLGAGWTLRGQPVPYLGAKVTKGEPLGDPAIPVERIRGPILFISGQDDRLIPSDAMVKEMTERLKAHAFPYRYIHLSYPDAGHSISFPYEPTTIRRPIHPYSKRPYTAGGTAEGEAAANADSWPKLIAFLRQAAGS